MQEFKSEAEVNDLFKSTGQELIIFEGFVYDVKEFKSSHPAGAKIIEKELGTNIEEKFEEEGHSKTARKLMKTLPVVGFMAGHEKASKATSDST